MVADRAREQWLPSIGTPKRACRFEGHRPGGVPLRFWLSTRLLKMKKKATDRFVRDARGGCYCAQRFLLLHHTTQHRRLLGSEKSVCRLLWPWPPLLDHRRRRASRSCFLLSKQTLHLLIQCARRSKEEAENWRQRTRNPSVPVRL